MTTDQISQLATPAAIDAIGRLIDDAFDSNNEEDTSLHFLHQTSDQQSSLHPPNKKKSCLVYCDNCFKTSTGDIPDLTLAE